jgi:hypothetical protein
MTTLPRAVRALLLAAREALGPRYPPPPALMAQQVVVAAAAVVAVAVEVVSARVLTMTQTPSQFQCRAQALVAVRLVLVRQPHAKLSSSGHRRLPRTRRL